MKIIMTGFDPFGGETVNPAWEAVKLLPDVVGNAELVKLELPTVFGRAGEKLLAAVERYHPVAVIAVGQAGGAREIAVERIAVNLRDARIPDNAGAQPVDVPVCPEGPAAYFTTLPAKMILSRLQEEKIPAKLSNSAGTFVCNDLLYTLLHGLSERGIKIPAGFIHVPYAPEQAAKKGAEVPSMALSQMAAALKLTAETALE